MPWLPVWVCGWTDAYGSSVNAVMVVSGPSFVRTPRHEDTRPYTHAATNTHTGTGGGDSRRAPFASPLARQNIDRHSSAQTKRVCAHMWVRVNACACFLDWFGPGAVRVCVYVCVCVCARACCAVKLCCMLMDLLLLRLVCVCVSM